MQAVHQVASKRRRPSSVLRETREMEPGMAHDRAPESNCFCPLLVSFVSRFYVLFLKCLFIEPLGGSCSEDGHRGAWRRKDQRSPLPAASCHSAQQLNSRCAPSICVQTELIPMLCF